MSYWKPRLDGSTSDDETGYILSKFNLGDRKGYGPWMAGIFIASVATGIGVLALPKALAGTGWFGLVVLALAWLNSGYCGILMGESWIMMEKQWEEYRVKFRYPYPAMGLRAVGPWMRYTVSVTLAITLLGIAVVFVLISAQVVQSMTNPLFHLAYHYWIIIISVVLIPFTWFGRFEELRFAGIGALVSAILACYGIFVGILMDIPHVPDPTYKPPTLESFSLAFGSIVYAFGGVFFLPNVQNDMNDRCQFKKATFVGLMGMLLAYLPVTIGGYAVYGSDVYPNILASIQNKYAKLFSEICLCVHIFLAFLLEINPVAQEIEDAFKVKQSFNYKRCIIRSLIVLLVMVIAYSIPHFLVIINLIGGSTMTLLTFIFPGIFYIRLKNKISNDNDICERKISVREKLCLTQMIALGILAAIICTYFAFIDLVNVFSNKIADPLTNY